MPAATISSMRVNAAGRRRGVKGLRGEGVKRWEGEKVRRIREPEGERERKLGSGWREAGHPASADDGEGEFMGR